MIYPHKKIINNQEGVAAVEFAIILPLLLLFIFGIIEFSLFLYNKQVITNAAREGARRGVIIRAPTRIVLDGTDDDGNFKMGEDNQIRARIEEFTSSYLVTFGTDIFETDTEDVIIQFSFDDPDDIDEKITLIRKDDPTNPEIFAFETDLIVKVNFTYQFLFIFPIIETIELTSIATMKME